MNRPDIGLINGHVVGLLLLACLTMEPFLVRGHALSKHAYHWPFLPSVYATLEG